jgi:opacity protein-like surface antigen
MKKFLLSMVVLAGLATTAQAQVHPHALGLRFAGGSINGAELSYQHGLSNKNRLEFDLGAFSNDNLSRIGLAGIYQWDWNLTGGLNWYIGPGAALSLDKYENGGSGLGLAVGGQIGLEYDLNKQKLPLLISLDTRPMYDLIGDYKGFGWGLALGVRYTWGKTASKK